MNIKSTSLALAGAVALALGSTPLVMAQTPTNTMPPPSTAAQNNNMNRNMNGAQGMHHMSKGQVMHLQRKLDQHGEHVKQDGRWGHDTRSALMKFQRKNGLRATGYPNKKTLSKLGISHSRWMAWSKSNAMGAGTMGGPAAGTR
jgi:hypothetical protein